MKKIKVLAISLKLKLLRIFWRIKYSLFREKIPENSDGKIYLNLGSGLKTSPEFINIDAFPWKNTHLVSDIRDLSFFPSDFADLIYASHVVEHIPRTDLVKVLKEWRRVLKPGGIFRFGVPDFDKLLEAYNESGKDIESVLSQLLGQDDEYNRHYTLWNMNYAKSVLKKAGFLGEPKIWDPLSVSNHGFKDKTGRAFNFKDKVIPISLNIEVSK